MLAQHQDQTMVLLHHQAKEKPLEQPIVLRHHQAKEQPLDQTMV
jgi:hypothetical protein